MKNRALTLWMLMLVLLSVLPARAAQDQNRRFYASTILSWWPNSKDISLFQKFVDESKQKGMNAVSIDVPWSIERRDGTYDFTDFDTRLNYIISNRLSAFVKLNMSTAGGQRPYWLTDDMLMATPDGKVFALPDGVVFPSLSHPVVLKKAKAFAGAVVKHLNANYAPFASGEYPVVAVIPAVNSKMAMDYPSGADVDYSASARADFKKWAAGLSGKRRSGRNSMYRTWSEGGLEKAPVVAKELYFSYTIKRFFDEVAAVVRKYNPTLDVALKTSAGWEDPSGHTLLLADIAKKADWLIVADLPQSNHSFTVDVTRMSAMGKKISTEIDAPIHISATNARYFNQGVRSFEHGASAIMMANWDLANVRNNKSWPFLHDMGKLARIRRSWPKPSVAIYLSVWDLIEDASRLEEYEKAYDKITENGKIPVDILTDPVIAVRPEILQRYKTIHLPANWTIPEKVRTALLSNMSKLVVSKPLVAGTMDEYQANTRPLIGASASDK